MIESWRGSQDGRVFQEGLRAEVFEAFRHNASPGDWWLQLNADEFYIDDPRRFFGKVPLGRDFVWGIPVEYYVTDRDLQELDFRQAIEQFLPQLRFYKVFWSEPRAFRYRKRLVWSRSGPGRHPGLSPRTASFQALSLPFSATDSDAAGCAPQQSPTGILGLGICEGRVVAGEDRGGRGINVDDGSENYLIDCARLPRHTEDGWVRLFKRVLHYTGIWP